MSGDGGGFLRSPSSSFASTHSSASGGQSRADEPAQTPQQRDEDKARADLVRAGQLAAEAKKLDQVPAHEWQEQRDQLAKRLDDFQGRLQSTTAAPSEAADRDRIATAGKVAEARATLDKAKPPRAVEPVAGEEAIAESVADKSISPEAVIDWMAGLSKSERETVWRRYGNAHGNRADTFAVALANYVAKHRIADDLRGLARMTDRQLAEWRTQNQPAGAPVVNVEPIGQSKPLDPLGQSRPLDPTGQSFADPSRDADHDGHADPFTATPSHAPAAAPAIASIGQSKPLDPLGQSRPLDPLGQSFADPSRDADHDGRADLFITTAQPSPDARQLAGAVAKAIAGAHEITDALLPSYTDALDALDLAAVGDAAAATIGAYHGAATVRAQLRAQLGADVDAAAPEHAADRGLLSPLGDALDTALAVAEAQLASGLGVQRFRGREVMPGVAPIRLGNPQTAAARLKLEAGSAQGLIATIHQVAESLPTAAEASAAGVSEPVPRGSQAAADQIRIWAGRPVHFAFLKAALSERGIWQQLEHAIIPGDGRSLGQLDQDVTRQAARFGAMNDVGQYRADLAGSFLIGGNPSRENVAEVLAMIETAEPDARGPILTDLQHRGLLDGFAARLTYAEAERLHDSTRGPGAGVRSVLRSRYGENPRTGDNTVSNGLGKVPLIGGALDETLNVFTFGYLHEHDAAHRRMQSGEITEDEYVDASDRALMRATAVGAVSTVTGGAAGAYVEGLTASIAARGVAGRITSTTATGVAGGAVGNAGARLGSDLVDGELSSIDEYGHDALIGGAIGGGIGFGASSLTSAAKYLPERVKTPIHRLLSRLPSVADDSELYAAIRSLGEHDSRGLATFTAEASRITELAALRVVTLSSKAWQAVERFGANTRALGTAARNKVSQFADDFADGFGPQLATPNGAPARFRFTAEAAQPLHLPGPDGPVLHVLKAERLGDDLASHADDFADDFGGRDAVDLMEGNEPRRASFADEAPEVADDFADEAAETFNEADLPLRAKDLAEAHPDGLTVRNHSDARQSGIVSEPGALNTEQHHVFPKESKHAKFFRDRGLDENKIHNYTIDIDEQLHQLIHVGRDQWEQEWSAAIIKKITDEEKILGHLLNVEEMEGVARELMAAKYIDPATPFRRWEGAPKTKAPPPKRRARR